MQAAPKTTKTKVYYFRSLDTAGRDVVQFGLVRFGTFATHFERELKDQDLDFVPVLKMGAGSIEEQAENAKRFLKENGFFDQRTHNHFFGHSAGGLVAKLVASDPAYTDWVTSLITVGTPHHGSQAAEWAAALDTSNPRLTLILKLFGYNVVSRRDTFESFKRLAKMNIELPKEMFTGSIVCGPPREEWSWLYRLVHSMPIMREFTHPSDGLIQKDSQVFGNHQWEFNLDHAQQIGYGGKHQEFKRMCELLATTWKTAEEVRDQNFFKREISLSASLSSARDADS